jgi:hypothetical protein
MTRVLFAAVVACRLVFVSTPSEAAEPAAKRYDVVVYGGTSGGIAAAVQVARMGKSVVLVEPTQHVGGLTSGGLGATDIGNKAAIGGISREFYRRIGDHYRDTAAWKWEQKDEFRSGRQRAGEQEMWVFEPHVAEQIYREMLADEEVPVVYGERLDLKDGLRKEDGRIASIRMESGRTYAGKMFIDATYEGDLMAKAGVSYHVGRESDDVYGETLNGFHPGLNVKNHRFIVPVDPYVVPGDASSGLLPRVHGDDPGSLGKGDQRVQAYCLRMCMTDVPENRVPWPKPENYDPRQYEILLRNFEAGDHRVPWNPIMMPNRKTDTNNNGAFSTDNIGMNYDYPEADYEAREQIIREHEEYQAGLMWTLAHHPRVPEKVRKEVSRWGLAKDEFTDNGHWPHQLYVREARRMISDHVMSQSNCQGREVADDSVGLGAYGMDSHNVQRYVDENGHVQNEGDVQVHGFAPYPIAYRSIRPKKSECENLLVPVCLSASHIAYGSIRMEPVFMVLGQSAATAAVHAIEQGLPVQDVDMQALRERLLTDQQVLEWTGPRPQASVDPAKLPGLVLDDTQAELKGAWSASTSIGGFVGAQYLHDGDMAKGEKQAVFRPKFNDKLPPGRYEVRIAYTANPNRATNVPVTIRSVDGERTVALNQRQKPEHNGFASVGTFRFDKSSEIVVSNRATNGHVIIDAVQFLPSE